MSDAAPSTAAGEVLLGDCLANIIASPVLSQQVHEVHLLFRPKPRKGQPPLPSAAKIVWKNGAVDCFGDPQPTGFQRWTIVPGSVIAVSHGLAMSHPDRKPAA